MRKKLQVFISSTYTDLIEERQAAVEAVLSLEHIPAGMELFKASNESQLDTIKRWIDESDIYLLILGGRYGSLEPNSQLSYTQVEYEYAVKKDIPLFAIVIKDEAIDQKVRELGRSVLETDNPDKYKKFRDLVLSKTSLFFSDKKDIKVAIANTISDFEKRFEFKGWVSGDILNDYNKLKQENTGLVEQMQKQQSLQSTTMIDEESQDEMSLDDEKDLPVLNEEPTPFFSYRVTKAFPGIRGLEWFDDPKVAVERLKILLKKPIKFKVDGKHYSDPIWYFHGSSCLSIEQFEVLSDTKVLLGSDEIEIDKIAVFNSPAYFRAFVYVEAKPEVTIGLYETTEEDIERQVKHFGYASEEYGVIGDNPITRAEYDDGAAVINGKVVDAKDAKLRVRYLSKFNFIIAAKTSPYNSSKCDLISDEYLNGILNDTHSFDYFLSELIKLPKNPKD